ncbi:PDZ domain-containing protein [Marinicella gelatinilytica]|uniref:PDZ domain-containing protein n=1 Tax=Marinicella gelatinilytica TaxID=2996017 RepID=UPI002260A190|nr:PDZ domain-containing protein [Marinicella gelatinilytica]MCX7544335.1 PDZ domain-containing protein [Marinicella gelatinilytica]
MKYLNVIILIFISSTLWAADNEHLDIHTQIQDGQGKVIIIHNKDGKQNKIEESFDVTNETDVDQVVSDALKKHHIDIPPKPPAPPQHNWTQQLDNVDVEVIDNMVTITIKQDNNGSVKLIEETFKIDDTDDINKLIEEVMKKHDIEVDQNANRQVIQIDRNYFSSIDIEGAYFGFMASVEDKGWQVITVIPNSGADQAGLQQGDLIVAVDNQKTTKGGIELKNLTKEAKAGQKSTFKIVRNGKNRTLNITAQKRSLSDAVLPPIPPMPPTVNSYNIITMDGDNSMTPHVIMRHQKLQDWLGDKHQLIAVNPGLKTYFGTDKGVLIVNVDKNNKLALAEGDVILSINGDPVNTPKQAVKALSALKLTDGFNIEVMRKKEKISIAS